MKKSFNFLVVITLVITFALTSCNNTDISLTTNTNSTTISSSTNTNSTTTSQHIHTFSSSYEYDGTYHWHPSTCGHDVQGDIEEHTFTEEIINPTYDSIGYTTYTCLTCGYSYTDDEVDKLEHNYSSTWSYNSSSHWHACTDEGYEHLKKDEGSHTFTTSITNPSYEHGGYTTYTCSVCGYSYTDDETNALPITITWKNYDGTILEVDNNVPYGTMPNYDGEIPTKESDALHYYTFEKWNPEIVSATSNATYVASYTQHECDSFIISYNANGGSGAPSSQTKPKGFTITLESTIPTYEGYTFVGWNNIYENTVYNAGSSFNLDLNVTLYAMWEKNCEHCNHTGTVTISSSCAFCWGSGKKCNSCGSTSVKQVVSQGYSYYQCNLCGSRSIGNCSSCGGSGKSTSTQTCSYCNGLKYEKDVSPTMSSIEPRRAVLDSISGYEYSIDGINFQSSPVFNNLKPHTSYSFYQRIATNGNKPFGCTSKPLTVSTPNATTYFVEYDLNGGINNTSNPSSYSTSGSSIPLKNPTREHYDFVGWTYNGSIVTSISPSWNEDITLVANWKTTEYSITYNLNGGSGDNPTTHGIETGSISLTEPTKNGYTFIGWTGSNGTEPSTDVTIEAGNTDNLSYTANWSLNTYSITYELNGGENNSENPSTYTVEDDTIILKNPTREHYDFAGWKNGNSSITKIYTSNAKDYVLSATWTPHNYSITYDYNGGNGNNPSTHTIESNDITLTEPTKNGYTFIGWTGSNGTEPSTDVTIEAGNTDNLSYTANWSLNTYSITYELNGGENSTKNPNSYTTEDTITLKDATKDYYTFDGWYKEPEFINRVKTLNGQYGDLTLYAKFIPFTYSSTFDASGGQIDNEINIRIVYGNDFDDEFITINANSSLNIHNLDFPYKTGYTFAGFFFDKEFTQPVLSSNQLNTDQTIYAKWDTQYSEIHTNNWLLNVNDPYAETSERPEGRKSTSTTMTYMVPLYSTGTFTLELDSWYGFRTGIGTNYTIINLTTGTTLFSGRLSNSCEKVFNCNPGDIIQCSCSSVTTDSTSNYKVNYALLKVVDIERSDCCTSYTGTDYKCNQQYGELVSIPTVSKQGYDFTGWYDEQNNPISNTWNYTSDQNFHAEWSIHNYSVSYNLNGGLNNPSNPTSFVYTDYIELLSPEREGYTFAGWYSDASFKNKVTYIDGSTFNDIELFAKWIPNSYTVTLDYNGGQNCPTIKFYSQGNVIKTVDLYKDSTFDYFIPEAPNESLKFGGWYTDSNCTKLFSFDGVVNTDINLYAKWINVSNSEYSQLGNDVDVQINGNNYGYIAICSPINQTITITSSSGLDLYGVIYDSNWNIIASCDDISDENFDFSITITLEAGKMYYIGYKANQVSISGDCVISISGINQPDTFITGDYTEIIGSINVTYDTSFELPVPKKKGCEFIGWFDENGNPIDLTSWNYSENITIYAHWRAI